MELSVIDRELIVRLKDERGLSFAGLAAEISERTRRGISRQALEQFIAGANSMNVEHFAAMAAVLGVGVSDLIREKVSA